MNIFKKAAGKILYGIAKLVSVVLDIFIKVVESIVTVLGNVTKGLIAFIGMGGCLLLFIFSGPLGLLLLMNPVVLLAILFFVIFPLLGTKFVSYLKYIKYIVTEFLFDRARYLIDGISYQFESFSEYKDKYRRMEEERKRREQQQRWNEQQRVWEERFKQWSEYQRKNSGYSDYEWYRQNTGNSNQNMYQDPTIEFKKKYEESCDLLGVKYDADKYEIKLAYRKKAKEYHPDLNKSPDATVMFQKINNAYEFLSDSNIERYRRMA